MVDQFNVACSIVTALAAPVLGWQGMSVAMCAMSHRHLGIVWLTYTYGINYRGKGEMETGRLSLDPNGPAAGGNAPTNRSAPRAQSRWIVQMRKKRVGLCMFLGATAPVWAQVSIGVGLPGVSIGINLPVYPQLVRVPGYRVY